MNAAWLAVRAFLGGLPAWVLPAIAGVVALGAITWGIYHAGSSAARADAAEQLAKDNADALNDERAAKTQAVAAFRDEHVKALQIQSDKDALKEEIARVAQGNASAGCRTAVLGVLKRADAKVAAPVMPHRSR